MKERTTDALEILDRRIGEDPDLRRMIEEERIHAQIAREIHHLRTTRGLTQQELAKLVGTSQSAIARLEDADYDGHSLRMLRRIATALGARISFQFVSDQRP